ncbi:hypothetical protein K493DRAFT_333481 [Basidiobolus meristosporus CBS 931.73]|uniref:DUF4604 domain-containing protein n=1 Tax=Basidiobolus meristosporus CBS 931.73 TaxID=1314790 RepID=A0A1Y1Z779_9FUNG|nr:hypothetical protein K493DRAFT_333481 [Basidiobolus meristosporus CBS 931.73]|eukprot:ORY05665.1 hypothetical protein K493DRAFT_333481 [Basidiobolus meristosporus CBS 931.73]
MPPKNLTPYQFSKNLSYVQDTPKFLQMLTGKDTLHPKGQQLEDKLPPTELEEDEYEETGEEKPQIVVLKEGKHLSAEEVEKIQQDNDATSSPEDGKIRFRKPKKTQQKIEEIGVSSSKRKQPSKEASSADTTSTTKGKKKKMKSNKNLLSFAEEEE